MWLSFYWISELVTAVQVIQPQVTAGSLAEMVQEPSDCLLSCFFAAVVLFCSDNVLLISDV